MNRDKAKKIIKESIIWDNSLLWAEMLPYKEESLEDFYKNKVNVVSLKINTPKPDVLTTLRGLIITENELNKHKYQVIKSEEDIKMIKENNKTGITFSLCDASIIEDIDTDFDIFSSMGVTHTILCAERNRVGDSCWEPTDVGLSNFGRQYIKKANTKKIILDGTLGGHKTTMEAMELSDKPFVFSHTNPYSICKNKRNIKDDQIKTCAATGGVIGITFLGGYLGEKDASTEIVFKNIDYICSLVGSEHVGFGSNFSIDPSDFWQKMTIVKQKGEIGEGTCFSYNKLQELVQMMIEHGYSEKDIRYVLGENWLRIYRLTI